MSKFVKCVAYIAKTAVRPFFPVKVYGERNIPNKKSLIVGNHLSGWDPIILTMWTKNMLSFVYKAEFRGIPFLRWLFDNINCVPVKRGDADISATKAILKLLNNDNAVVLFPEGTRNPNIDCLQQFHTGAALFALKTHAPLRPFYIWDKTKSLRKNYILIGEEFCLDDFYDRPITHDTLAQATEFIKQKVDELRLRLNEHLSKKGVKHRKRTGKEMAKLHAYNSKQKTFTKQVVARMQDDYQDANADGDVSGEA